MVTAGRGPTVELYVESGAKKVFACALDWPGWCRSGKTEEMAVAALTAYAARYAIVAARAGLAFDPSPGARFTVREHLAGTTTTDFGAPAVVAAADHAPLSSKEAQRLAAILRAAWDVLDDVVATAPAELRKGPRGGGRDRDAIAAHVLDAEVAYARKLGLRGLRSPAVGDVEARTTMRDGIAEVISRSSDVTALWENGWLPRYAARRLTWHVLDHAWEIEDRSAPAGV